MRGEWFIKEPRGHRSIVDYNVTPKYVCSNCNREAIKTSEEHRGHGEYVVEHTWYKTDFCPNCGADMRGGKNEMR